MQDKRVCKISFPYSEKIKQTKLKRSTRGIKVSLWGIEPSWSIGYHIFRFVSIRIDLTRRLKSGHGEKEVESISEFFLASVFIFDFHFRLDTKIKLPVLRNDSNERTIRYIVEQFLAERLDID